MNKSFRLSVVLLIILIASSSVSLAGTSQIENDIKNNITVEQYIYSLMQVFSIEPSDQSVEGITAYVKEAENRYWIDMDTPRPLNRPLEKHEMIDLAVTALREKGEVQYGTPSEIHDMVKDFKDVPYRSRIATVLGINMGLVKLGEDGNINPFEKVRAVDASKFLVEVKKASEAYPNYKYLTENFEYETPVAALSHCLLMGCVYGDYQHRRLSLEGLNWNELYCLGEVKFNYDDISVMQRKIYETEERITQKRMHVIFGIYKPGPVLHLTWADGKVVNTRLGFEIDESIRKKRLEMVRELCKVYYPLEHLELLSEYTSKHTSDAFLVSDRENNETIIIGDMLYCISHADDVVWFEGVETALAPNFYMEDAKVISYEKN